MHAISISELLFIEADGNYCNIWLTNNDPFVRLLKDKREEESIKNRDEATEKKRAINKITLVMQIGDIENVIKKSSNKVKENLVRIGRSYIINLHYLFKIDLNESLLWLMDTDHNIFKLKMEHNQLTQLKKGLGK